MDIVRMFDRRVAYFVAAIALLLAFALPALVGAAQVTARSIQLSSSSKGATGVSYALEFTAPTTANSIIIDFCSNSPLIGAECDAPSGMNVGSTTPTSGYTGVAVDSNTIQIDKTTPISAASTVNVVVSGVTNPSAVGPLYARVLTYTTANVSGYTDAETLGTYTDEGSVALYITDSANVSGAVLESMVFCVSKTAPTKNCETTTAPTLKLGEDTGGVIALNATSLSTGDLFTQLSTNAASGAIVRLKSSATNCGGLLRAGATSACDILPAGTSDFSAGTAKFGVRVATDTDPSGVTPSGTFQAATGSPYNSSTYALRYVDNTDGVTGTYGDEFLDSDGAPVNNRNMKLTFGASISNDTPAGLYSADLSLIATGKF